jgi:hypothetical protein
MATFNDSIIIIIDADNIISNVPLTKAPQDSRCQFEEPAVSSYNSASSSDRDKSDPLKEKEKEGWGDEQLLTGIAVSRGIAVAFLFLAGPIIRLLNKCFNKNDNTPVPDTGAQNELKRGGQVAQEGAHQSTRSAKGALAIQKDIS